MWPRLIRTTVCFPVDFDVDNLHIVLNFHNFLCELRATLNAPGAHFRVKKSIKWELNKRNYFDPIRNKKVGYFWTSALSRKRVNFYQLRSKSAIAARGWDKSLDPISAFLKQEVHFQNIEHMANGCQQPGFHFFYHGKI